jgi:hypothetical protein
MLLRLNQVNPFLIDAGMRKYCMVFLMHCNNRVHEGFHIDSLVHIKIKASICWKVLRLSSYLLIVESLP